MVGEREVMEWWSSKVRYCAKSPSGIVWIKNGQQAGYLNPNGYWYIGSTMSGHRISTLVHRIVYFLHNSWQEGDIDHINGDGSKNLIENIRLVSTKINCRNMARRSDNKTDYTGVTYEAASADGRTGDRYRAHWIDESGKSRVKNFPVSKFGDLAFENAVSFRNSKLEELRDTGEGYTSRHGM